MLRAWLFFINWDHRLLDFEFSYHRKLLTARIMFGLLPFASSSTPEGLWSPAVKYINPSSSQPSIPNRNISQSLPSIFGTCVGKLVSGVSSRFWVGSHEGIVPSSPTNQCSHLLLYLEHEICCEASFCCQYNIHPFSCFL